MNKQNWKPTEEQMNALNAINCTGSLSYIGQSNALLSLYNDLKKLLIMKEEIELIKITIPTENAYLIDEHVTEFANIVGKMTTLYAKKNHDYGNSFDEGCDKIGVGYPLGRMLDKMNRLIACMGKEETMQVNESIEDTLTDLACYSVMTLSYLNRKKKSNNSSTGRQK